MPVRYLVLGAGRQGTAAAYDLARHGNAASVVFGDSDLRRARSSAERVNALVRDGIATGVRVDAAKADSLSAALRKADVLLSAVPYRLNLGVMRAAAAAGTGAVDLGGNTDIVRAELALDAKARKSGAALVPDCGMGPGLNVSLAVYAMGMLDEPRHVYVCDGGLPQDPRPPWNYALTFHVEGLTNEYAGTATFLRRGKLVEVPAMTEVETVEFPPAGTLEAFVTSGGLSTAPWTFQGALTTLENKTLRFPGHFEQLKAFADLGLFGTRPIRVGDQRVVPRQMFHALFEPQVAGVGRVKDMALMRCRAIGMKDGVPREARVELVDAFDEATGFTSMERLTGWHAAMVAEMIGRGEIAPGAHSVESGVPPKAIVDGARVRGLNVVERYIPG